MPWVTAGGQGWGAAPGRSVLLLSPSPRSKAATVPSGSSPQLQARSSFLSAGLVVPRLTLCFGAQLSCVGHVLLYTAVSVHWRFGPAGALPLSLGPGRSLAGLEPCPPIWGFLLHLLPWCFGKDVLWTQGLCLQPLVVAGAPASECCPHLSPPSSCLLPAPPGLCSRAPLRIPHPDVCPETRCSVPGTLDASILDAIRRPVL